MEVQKAADNAASDDFGLNFVSVARRFVCLNQLVDFLLVQCVRSEWTVPGLRNQPLIGIVKRIIINDGVRCINGKYPAFNEAHDFTFLLLSLIKTRHVFEFEWQCSHHVNKVTTTMVIRPLDDRTYCIRYAFTHFELWQKLYDCSRHKFTATKMSYQTCSIDIFIDLQPFGCNLKRCFSTTRFWDCGAWVRDISPFDSQPMGSY